MYLRGLCGTFDGDRDNDLPARSGEEWRLSAGQNMFSSRPVAGPGTRRREVCTQQTEIVMMTGRDRGNPPSLPSHVRHYTDITPVLLGTEDTDSAGEGVHWTTLQEEREREEEEEVERDVEREVVTPDYPTPSGQTEKSILSLCADTVLNSSLSTLCAAHIQDKLYLPLDICVLDVVMMDDPSWAQFSLALVEMMCEEEVSRAQLGWHINYSGDLVPASLVVRALNCPNNCSSHGDCRADRCDCYPGYSSYDCSHVDGQSHILANSCLLNVICRVQLRPHPHTLPRDGRQQLPLRCQLTRLSHLHRLRPGLCLRLWSWLPS